MVRVKSAIDRGSLVKADMCESLHGWLRTLQIAARAGNPYGAEASAGCFGLCVRRHTSRDESAVDRRRAASDDEVSKKFPSGTSSDPRADPKNPKIPATTGDPHKPSVGLEPTTPSLPWKCSTS